MLGVALASTACGDTTGPGRLVDGSVAHAIPGAGTAFVSVDLTPTFQLQPLQHTYFVVTPVPRSFEVELGTSLLSIQVQLDRDITAIILLDLDGPTLRAYHLDRDGPEQRIAVVNGHAGAGDLNIEIDGLDSSFALTVAPGEADHFEPPAGAFSIRVRGEGDEASHDLAPITLEVGDYGFLVVVPGPSDEQPYDRLLF